MRKLVVSVFLSLFISFGGEVSAQVTYTEDNDIKFSSGSYNSTYLTGSGTNVNVGLEYYGRSVGFSTAASKVWFDGTFKYRRPVLVVSSNSATLSNYAVALTINTQSEISGGRMNSDGSDIRFTTAAVGGYPVSYSYYIESGINTSSTKIWVKIPSVSNGNNNLYMYYGSTSASSVSGIESVFVMGDNFNGANGASPSSTTWVNVQSADPVSGSVRDIQSNRLRFYYGSPSGTRHFGLRSANYYSFSSGRKYHFEINARNTGSDSYSNFTLCPTLANYSYGQDDWLRFSVKHSASGPAYTLEKSEYGIKSNLVSQTSLSSAFHAVDIIITSASVKVLLDDSEIYSGANNLTFTNPYIYLEATSSYNGLEDYLFDNVYINSYSSPEPAFNSTGNGQGRYYPDGYFLSQSIDTGADNTRAQKADWTANIPSGSTITVSARGHNTDVSLSTFTNVSKGDDPAVSGRYLQYRLLFETSAPLYTGFLSSITLTYVSPPSTPTSVSGQALSASSIKWQWTDASSGQFQEENFRISDSSNNIKGSVSAGTTYWIETGLNANTQYPRYIYGYNQAGDGFKSPISRYTLPLVPSVSCDKSTGTWLNLTMYCSNLAGFGANGVQYYRYVWNNSSLYSWSGSETQWTSGSLPFLPGSSGEYYLHLRSYNGDNAFEPQDATYGPYWYDKLTSQITGFAPSSMSWTNTGFSVNVAMTDTGGSNLYRVRYKWTLTTDKPASGWQAWDYSILDSTSSSVNITIATQNQWYLHVEVEDKAGNVGYSYSGPYKIDVTKPTGSISINNGAVYTPARDVTLYLTYSDGLSGVKDLAYRNTPGGIWSQWELPQPTTSWTLFSGDGDKTVTLQVRDNAGNTEFFSDGIILDSKTSLFGSTLSATASGIMGEPAETFNAEATLKWSPTMELLGGKTIYFYFNNSTKTADTNQFGAATANFNVPDSSGTYVYGISFQGDSIYSASSSTGTLSVSRRSVLVITEDVNTTSNSNFIAKATLKDQSTENVIIGATVTFIFEGSTETAITNDLGVATVTFTAPEPVGYYYYYPSYDGNHVYSSKSASGMVGVGLRITTLVVPPLSSPAQADFDAQATLMDSTTPIQGASINFYFPVQDSTQTAVTNDLGIATTTWTAPSSTGTYQISASFDGDATYAPSSKNSSLSVTQRPLSMVPETAQGYVNATIQSKITLYDGITSQKVSGKNIVFNFEGSTTAVITDSSGISTAVFNSGSAPRDSSFYAYFQGDGTYAFAESTGSVSIKRRPVTVSAFDTTSLINSTWTASAELKDIAFSPVVIQGATVYFSFRGSTKTAQTGSDGVASVSYDSGVSTGTYDFYAWSEQNTTYEADNDTATVSISKRPSLFIAYPKYVFAFDTVQLVAELKDGITGDYLAGKSVTFDYEGVPQSTVTVSTGSTIGRAYAVYPGTGVAGAYSYSVNFDGDDLYTASNSSAAVNVWKRPISLSAFPATVIWGTTWTATAEMRDGNTNALISGKTIRLVFQSSTVYNVTQSGIASTNFAAPSSTGAYNWVSDFAGDSAYNFASSTGTVTVNKRTPVLTAFQSNKYVLDTIYLSASLLDGSDPLPSKQLSFYFRGSTITTPTNGSGMATAGPFTAVSTAGTYGYTVFFAGDAGYSSQTSSSVVVAEKRISSIDADPVSAVASATFTVVATLLDDIWSTPVTGVNVTFLFQSVSSAVVTDTNGIARAVYSAPSSTGTISYSATFAGNNTYLADSDTDTVTVGLRSTVLQMGDYYPTANSTFTVQAVLKDYLTNATISTKTVSFLFLGSTRTAVTDALGYATTSYAALSSTQSYPISASFAGDSYYAPSSVQRTVFPAKRQTVTQTSDILNAVAKDTFTVTARLKDFEQGYYISGATFTFSFTGSSYTLNAVTNSTGTASAVFTAPTSTGNYSYTATFNGASLYLGSFNTSSVLVNRRTPSLSAQDLTGVPANSTFTAAAYLKDGSVGIATATLKFIFISTKTAITNAVGYTSSSFVAPSSTGTYYYEAVFDGNALYNPKTDYGSIAVVLRPTLIELLDVNDAVVGLAFTGTAKLRDIEAGNELIFSTKTIEIKFSTVTVNSITDFGIATAAFVAPSSTGTYSYSAKFYGDGIYGASQSTATVIVGRRPVLFGLVTEPSQPYAFRAEASNSSFTIIATLCDGQVAGLCLENKTITFVFQGSTKNVQTDSLGVASATYSSPISSGPYYYYGYFDGDASYNPNKEEDSVKTINVIRRPTYVQPDKNNGSVVAGSYDYFHTIDNYNTRSRLKDQLSNQPVQGMTLAFYVLGLSRTGVTDANGDATSSSVFPYVVNEGIYSATVTFTGNGTYEPSTLPGGLVWTNPDQGKVRAYTRPAFFDLGELTEAYPDETKVISGKLLDWWGNGTANTYLIGYPFSYRICNRKCDGACDTSDYAACSGYWSSWSNGVVIEGNISTATVVTPSAAGDYLLGSYFAGTSTFYFYNRWAEYVRYVRVGRRITVIIPNEEPVYVGATLPINITVKLADVTQSLVGIDGKDLDVVLVTTQTLLTGSGGGMGKVKATFDGMSVGTYTYIARFNDGDVTYMPYTSTGTVVVEKNTMLLTANDVSNIPAGNNFTAQAKLEVVVGTSTQVMAGKTIYFVFTSTGDPINLEAVTNSLGIATVTYQSPYVPNNYNFTAELPEDATCKEAKDLTNNVEVVKRITQLVAENASVYILETFVSTATLTDTDTDPDSSLPDKNISFYLQSSPPSSNNALTNGIGVASSTFASPSSSGTYNYSATFAGDTLYAFNSSTKTVTVSRRVTQLSVPTLITPTNMVFTATATLEDITHNLGVSTPVSSAQLKFVFNGGTPFYVTTDAYGIASATFTAPSVASSYNLVVDFLGNTTYGPSSKTTPITVRKRITVLSGSDVIVAAGAPFTAEAQLVDEFGQKLQNYSISFTFEITPSSNASNVTNSNGISTVTFTAPSSTGTYNYTASFAGDGTYQGSSDSENEVNVNIASTTITLSDGTGIVNNVYYATATLNNDSSGAGVPDKYLSFVYNGQSLGQVLTNSSGRAFKSFTLSSTGTYKLEVSFAGDESFYASYSSSTITVNRRDAGISVSNVSAKAGFLFIATATLTDLTSDPNTNISGRTVNFSFPDGTPVSDSAVTNGVGIATVSFTAPNSAGYYPVSVTFAGDAVYVSTNNSATVTVGKHITVVSVASGSVKALETFTATATLRDMDLGGIAVEGKTINFTYKSVYTDSDVTNVSGLAYGDFEAGSSSGNYRADAAFNDADDPYYATSSGSSTITVLRRDCVVIPDNISIKVFDVFNATVTFYDVANSSTPAGKTNKVAFTWISTQTTTATDSNGKAYKTGLSAPSSSGTYKVEAWYTGDVTYAPSAASTATVTVDRRNTLLSVADVNTIIGKVFYATATLKDASDNSLIASRDVRFVFEGNTFVKKTGTGGSAGIAVATFTVTISTGDNRIDAYFDGDSAYYDSTPASATVFAAMRPTYLTPVAATVIADETFIATATLKDTDNLNVPNQTVEFTFQATPYNAITNSIGVATVSITADVSTGTYNLPVNFYGDYKYIASSTTLTLTVTRRPTSVVPFSSVTVRALDVFYATATLKDFENNNLATKPLRFVFLSSTFNVTTDGSGLAVSTWSASASYGTYYVGTYFDGDEKYAPSTTSVLVGILQRPAGISLNPITSVRALDIFKSTAALSDILNPSFNVSTKTVSFTFSWGGSTGSVTDSVGIATVSYTATSTAGNYTLTGTFAGDGTYASTTTAISLPVIKRDCNIIGVDVSTRVLDVFTASATLTDAHNSGYVIGRTVKFTLQTSSMPAVTNVVGVATAPFTAPSSSGTYSVYSQFLGDVTYNPSNVSTKTLTLARRNSGTTVSGPASAIINSSVVFSAAMLDSVDARKIAGRDVSFYFQNSTITTVTNSFGVAYATYSASLSSGSYQVTASFEGDATYNVSLGTKAITMLPYPTSITANSITVVKNEILTATATLKDYKNNNVDSRPLVFYFNSSSFTSYTNGFGVSYATYSASVSTGTYQMPVSFAGDALYASTSSLITVQVNRRSSLITVEPVSVKALNIFTATATLKDGLNTSITIPNQTVQFEFYVAGSTLTNSGVTDINGMAFSTWTAPGALGDYQLKALFTGNATYYAASSYGTVSVAKRETKMSMPDVYSIIDEVFKTTATLTDVETLAPVSTKTITFTFGSSSSSLTDDSGESYVSFTAPSSSGTYQLQSSFAGDLTYTSSSSTSSLNLERRSLSMSADNIAGIIDEIFTATVTLTDVLNSQKVSTRTVSFVFNTSTFTSLTNGNGLAVSTWTAPSSAGTYTININFAGDARYLPNSTTTQISVEKRPATIIPEEMTARAAEIFTATAALVDVLNPGSKINSRQVKFVFNNSTFTSLTDSEGIAIATFTAPSSSGTVSMSISFDGDSRYLSTSTLADVTVLRRLSGLELDSPAVMALEITTITATLTDKLNPSVFVDGRTISFYFRGSTFTTLTGGDGVAVSTFSGPVSSGTYQVSAVFAGDAIYEGADSTSSVTVITRDIRILAADRSAYPYEQFIASATLLDDKTSQPVIGRKLNFNLDSVPKESWTNSVGIATAAYTPPSVFGDYQLDVSFAGDATYSAGSSSGTVSVMKRPTSISAINVETIAMEVFVASITLYDVRFAAPVPNKEILFTFETVQSTAATDSGGSAWVEFTAPVSSGIYTYEAAFAGDSVYAAISSTAAVTVNTRFTKIVAKDANANVGEPFTLSATLVDPAKQDLPGYYIPGVVVEFKFKDKDNFVLDVGTAATNEVGVATITFQGPGTPDVYYYTASFYGNYTYSPSSATAMVKVGLLTSMIAFDVDTYALSNFQVKVKLIDYLATPLNDKLIKFNFLGAPGTALTGAGGIDGVATAFFTAPASSGTYIYTTQFDGDMIYSPSNSTATIMVNLRPSSLIPYESNTTAYSSFTVTVGLKDILNPSFIVGGREVFIAFQGSTVTVYTSTATGEAQTQFVANFSSGTYSYSTWFYGDDTYSGTSATGTVNVTLKPTSMLSYNVYDVLANSTFTAKVQIKDAYNQVISNLAVDFEFDGNFGMGITNQYGIAESVFTAPSTSGTYTFNADFYGDWQYAPSSASGDVTVGPRPTMIFSPAMSFKLGNPVNIYSKLIDMSMQKGIETKNMTFYFNGATITALTDGIGIATAAFNCPESTGAYDYVAEFTGDNITYFGSQSSSTVTIALNITSIDARDNLSIKIYEPLYVDATLRDSIGLQLQGMPVNFILETSSSTSITNEVGKATYTFSTMFLTSTGTYYYVAEYPGDFTYVASSDTGRADVLRRDTLLQAGDRQTTPGKNFSVSATLSDNVNGSALLGAKLSGKMISFAFFDGVSTFTSASLTSVQGISSATFMAPVSTGTYFYTADFEDIDPVYIGFISTGTVTVLLDDGSGLIKTKLKPEPVETYITHTFITSATLTATDLPVPDKTVLFSFFNGIDTYTAVGFTDGIGLATASFTAPVSSGVYIYTANFAGDAEYAAATGTSTVKAALFPSNIVAQNISAYVGENFTARAVLKDSLTMGYLEGKTIVFEFFNGVDTGTLQAVTGSTGSAEAVFLTPSVPGDYTYTARFAGDSQYIGSQSIGSVLIASHGSSTFLVGYEILIGTGEVFAASGTLTSKGYPVPDKPVTITFQSIPLVSTTSVNGIALSSFTAPSSSGTFIYELSFAGDADYNSAEATGTVKVVFRKEPEQPSFKAELTEDNKVNLSWQPVSAYQQEVAGYIIEKSNVFRKNWTQQGYVPSTAPALGYSMDIESDKTTYVKVKTMLNDTQQSDTSLIVEIPKEEDRTLSPVNYFYISKDENAWIKIPGKIMDKLSSDSGFSMKIEKKDISGFSSSYEINPVGVSADQLRSEFKTVDRKGVKVTLSYGHLKQPGLSVSAASQQMALFWYNGVEWVRVGGEMDLLNDEITTYSKVFGKFALRMAPMSSGFTVTKVAPRIFSPDVPDTNINHRTRFYLQNVETEVTIRIFDITGALIKRNLEWESWPSIMFWDGKNQSGEKVKGGIYIYQIEHGDTVKTGTVVVAK